MAEFRMPSLGADMESGILTEWRVKPGDVVKRGDIVASVETSKGIIDVEIFDSGVIEKLLAEPGADVPVGDPLALYEPEGGEPEAPATEAGARGPTPLERAAAFVHPAPPAGPPPRPARRGVPAIARLTASPAARRRARELGIDLTAVAGTGPGGAIGLEDVEHAAAERRSAAAPADDMRSVIGRAMSRSKREIPHYYLGTTIDLTRALQWLEEWNAGHAVTERLLPGVLLLKAVACALEKVPELNGFVLDGRFEPSAAINVGVAISLRQGGVIAPGLDAANVRPLPELMRELQGMVQRTRAGRLRRTEITNATITVSSLGEGSVETVYPIIYPPQVAIVGFGSIVERPWVRDGTVVAARVVTATLAADHRASDGHRGAVFLGEIDRRLQHPEEL